MTPDLSRLTALPPPPTGLRAREGGTGPQAEVLGEVTLEWARALTGTSPRGPACHPRSSQTSVAVGDRQRCLGDSL